MPLPGVRVSDGFRVTRTGGDGRFELPLSDASGAHLFVTTPSGYWTETFFVPLLRARSGSVVFELEEIEDPHDGSLLFVTDVHLERGEPRRARERFAATMGEIDRASEPAGAILFGGDITLEGHCGDEFREAIAPFPRTRSMLGNHEMRVGAADPRGRFTELFGPSYYSFDWSGLHVIVLDGCRERRGESGWRNVVGRVDGSELEWLRADLDSTPDETPCIVAIHVPLASTYPERRGASSASSPSWVVANADEVFGALTTRDVRLVLQGHLHENERLERHGIECVETVSVCGSWWGAEGREDGVSGEPRGYRRVAWNGRKLRHEHVPSAESRVDAPGEWLGLLPGGVWDPTACPVAEVNIFDAPPHASVELSIDGGAPRGLPPATRRAAPLPDLVRAHHWNATGALCGLSPGPHHAALRCRDRSRAVVAGFARTVVVASQA